MTVTGTTVLRRHGRGLRLQSIDPTIGAYGAFDVRSGAVPGQHQQRVFIGRRGDAGHGTDLRVADRAGRECRPDLR